MLLKRIFLLSLLLATLFVQAQTGGVKFEYFSTEKGLSQTTISAILQDRYGFMWFGTTGGINRFDGHTFQSFQQDSENLNSLQGGTVTAMYEDRSGILWIGMGDEGLNRFDQITGKFTNYKYNPKDPHSLINNHVTAIYEDRNGVLWVGSGGEGGLNRFDKATGQFTRYQHNPKDSNSLSSNHVVSIYEDRQGNFWIGTSRNGLNKMDRKTGKCIRYENRDNNPEGLFNNSAWALFEDRKGNFWISGIGGAMHLFDRKTGQFTRFENKNASMNAADNFNVVISACEDPMGKFWLAAVNNGLLCFDPETREFTRFEHEPGKPGSINDNTIISVYADRSGVVWAGSFSAGVNKMNQLGSRFTNIQKQSSSENSLSSNSISDIATTPDGDLWVATIDGGINHIDHQTGKITWYLHQPDNPASLSSNTVRCVYADRQGDIWTGSYVSGMSKLDRKTGKFTHYRKKSSDPNSLGDITVLDIYEDRRGELWIPFNTGLSKMDRATGKFTHYPNPLFDAVNSRGKELECLLEDSHGNFWVGGGAGLFRFDRQTGKFSRYKTKQKKGENAIDVLVNTLFEDKQGRLWAGTNSGLYQVDYQRGQLTLFTAADGLADDFVAGIAEDDKGNLWLSTSKGISRFNLSSRKFRNYDSRDGLPSDEFSTGICKTADGKLVFGGPNGLTLVNPDLLKDNPHVPPVVLTDFQVFNQSVPVHADDKPDDEIRALAKPVFALDEVSLPYSQDVFSFEFAALDYTNPDKNQYAYQMEGVDKDWVYPNTRRFVTYTNLDPGTYTFRVKASNNDGVWNEKGRVVKVTILPPWYRTWWAYTLYGLMGIGALVLFRRYTIGQERLKADLQLKSLESKKLQEVDQLKTSFFTNISHEFRTPLTLILGPLEEMLDGKSDPQENRTKLKLMRRNARRLLELINQLLDLSRLDAGKLQLQARPDDLAVFLRTTVAAFETLAEQRRIDLLFNSQSGQIRVYFDRDKLEKILYNLLSNAFKFTPEGGIITVQAATNSNTDDFSQAIITVEDTGTGIAANQVDRIFDRFYQADGTEQSGSGIGLALTRELVQLHGGTIRVSSRSGEGTRFTISLPAGRAHLKDEQIGDEIPLSNPTALLKPLPDEVAGDTLDVRLPLVKEQELPLVLVIEDNPDMRLHLKSSLGSLYRVVEAHDGQQGLEKALELIPDLVISDVMMPKLGGFELCEKLKTDEKTSHIPVILLTARAGRESRLEGLETGADDYLVKPFDAEELRVRARNLIENRRKLRERFKGEISLPSLQPAIPSADDKFLKKAVEIVEANLSEADFSVDTFSREIGMSQSQLYRKLTALTGRNPTEFIRQLRLQRAAQLLSAGSGNVTEICYQVGFNNLSYFAKCFRELYSMSPSEFASRSVKVE